MLQRGSVFCAVAPGLESLAAAELSRLGLHHGPVQPGGFPLAAASPSDAPTLADVYRCHLHSTIISRVLARLTFPDSKTSFNAGAFSELRKKASRLNWAHFLRPGDPVRFTVSVDAQSKLFHKRAIEQRLRGAISDHFGGVRVPPGATEGAEQLITVRMRNSQCTVSADMSGQLLHKRGYRQAVGKAPLRENIAAAMLDSAVWKRDQVIVDPFCGSGTILIEAAMRQALIAPGGSRSFAFEKHPSFDADLWNSLLRESQSISSSASPQQDEPIFYGSDRDAGVIQMAKDNAKRAGVSHLIKFTCCSVSDVVRPPAPAQDGLVLTNPPYVGQVRVGNAREQVQNLYAVLGSTLKEQLAGWKCGVLSNDRRTFGQIRLSRPKRLLQISNGGIPVSFYLGKITRRKT